MKEDCLFCKIANGVFSSNTLYEDDDFRVIFDIAPVSKGHALILPKKHFDNIFDMDDEIIAKAYVLAKKMAGVMKDVLSCEGFNILQNNGEAAGQTVFHFHIHLVPRYSSDSAIKFGKTGSISDKEAAEMLEKIKEKVI